MQPPGTTAIETNTAWPNVDHSCTERKANSDPPYATQETLPFHQSAEEIE